MSFSALGEELDGLCEDAVTYVREKVYRNGDNLTANQESDSKKAAKLVLEDGEVFMRKKGKVNFVGVMYLYYVLTWNDLGIYFFNN